jgi:hypothetical protein
MRAHKFREGVVYERSEVPQDFLPLRTVEAEDPSLRRHIASLCQRGEVRRYRCGKRMFVHKDDIQSVRAKWHERKQATLALEFTPKSCGESNKGRDSAANLDAVLSIAEMRLTLGRIELILERLAVAAESLATQPLVRMDDIAICEPAASSNGFHS